MNQITFNAIQVIGRQREECFEILLDSRKPSSKLIVCFKNYDWEVP